MPLIAPSVDALDDTKLDEKDENESGCGANRNAHNSPSIASQDCLEGWDGEGAAGSVVVTAPLVVGRAQPGVRAAKVGLRVTILCRLRFGIS